MTTSIASAAVLVRVFLAASHGWLIVAAATLTGCSDNQTSQGSGVLRSVASIRPTNLATRAARRAYDGAPPIVAHEPLGVSCTNCHTKEGRIVPSIGAAPANPHQGSTRDGSFANCRQCHVFAQTDDVFADSDFLGLPQTLSPTRRAHALAPPVIPHATRMRSNCLACHHGPSARAEIVCSHPERSNCVQCHVKCKEDVSDEPITLTLTVIP